MNRPQYTTYVNLENPDWYDINKFIDYCNSVQSSEYMKIHDNMSHPIPDTVIHHLIKSYYKNDNYIVNENKDNLFTDYSDVSDKIFSKINPELMKNIIISFSFTHLYHIEVGLTIFVVDKMLKYNYNEKTLDINRMLNNIDDSIAYLAYPISAQYLCETYHSSLFNRLSINRTLPVLDWYDDHEKRFGQKNTKMIYNLGINSYYMDGCRLVNNCVL